MTPDVFLMPALGVVLAAVLPQLFARGIALLFERVEAEVDVRAAAMGPCLTCVGLLAFWGVRWVGPMAVDRPGAPLGLLLGVTLGVLAGLSAFQAVASLPMPVARAWPPIGAATGVIISALMLVGAVLLWRKTDLLPEDVRPPAYDDDAQALQLLAVERRAQVDPWDPELYLARAWHSVQNGHHERALSDLAIARRVGAGRRAAAGARGRHAGRHGALRRRAHRVRRMAAGPHGRRHGHPLRPRARGAARARRRRRGPLALPLRLPRAALLRRRVSPPPGALSGR
jgi:hypothetical protein